MNFLFKLGVKATTKKMKANDTKTKKSLPKIEGVNKYLSYRYASNYKKDIRMFNVYKPEIENPSLPLIIDFHGGAWVYGDKDLNKEYAMYLASKGFNVITFSYRLLTNTNLKGMVQDIFKFMNYIYKNKDKLEISFDNVMISGDSAGGHLALLTEAINTSPKLQKIYEVKPFDYDIDFMVLEHCCPYLEDLFEPNKAINRFLNKRLFNSFFMPLIKNKDVISYSSLDGFIKEGKFPPILCVTCTGDNLKRFHDRMIEEFKKNDIEYEVKCYEGMFHVFEILNYSLKESKEFNDYSLDRFMEVIKNGEK